MNIRREWPRLLVALTFVAGAPHCLPAQSSIAIPDRLSCSSCRIEIRDVVRLAGGLIPSSPLRVIRDAKGRYWLTFPNEPAMVYDQAGRFILQLKRGQGPGEFQYPWSVVAIADSVLVFDRTRGLTVLAPDLTPVRSIPATMLMGPALPFAWPDSVLINTRRFDKRDDLNPFHVVSLSGRNAVLRRSFGAEQSAAPNGPYNSLQMQIAPVPGGFWTAPYERYVLERWSLKGTLQQRLVRTPEWFPDKPPRMSFREPPPPSMAGLFQDKQNLLWVFVSVPAPTWREGYPKLPQGVGEVRAEALAYEKLFHTIIEVVDPRARRVVARATLDNYVVSPVEPGLAAIYDTAADGEPLVRIVRLTLRR